MYPYGGGQHPFGFSMGVTLDMRTGDQMALDTFMTASDTKVSNYIDRTLAKKVAGHEVHDEYNYPNIRSEDTAWSVSEAGLTFAFKQGAVAPESEDVVTLTVPWEIARS